MIDRKDNSRLSFSNTNNYNSTKDNYASTAALNFKERDMVSVDSSSMNDMSEYMANIKDENYKLYIQKKYEFIMKNFIEMDKDSNSYIDYEEMIAFLNKSMPKGEKFDPEMANKLFDLIDINKDNQCSLNEFAKTYIQIEEELKMQILKLRTKYEQKSNLLTKIKVEAQKYKNERAVEGDIYDNSKIFISILSVNFNDANPKFKNIFIKLIYNNNTKQTSSLSLNHDLIWNENFEFKVSTIKDELTLEIHDSQSKDNSDLIGKLNIPFDDITSQDEFECAIEIPEEKDSTRYTGSIKLKIQFIRSYFKYYTELALKAEEECREWQEDIMKVKQYFENLNQPFNYFNELNEDPRFRKYNYQAYFDSNLNNPIEETTSKNVEASKSDIEIKIAAKIEEIAENTLNQKNLPWSSITEKMLICLLALALISCCFKRADFITLTGMAIISHFTFVDSTIDQKTLLKYFIRTAGVMLGHDIFWILINFSDYNGSQYDAGAENTLKAYSLLLFFICFLGKIWLLILFYLQRLSLKKAKSKDPLLV